ncbi:unnamed protein product [Rhizoctonia solani]|uniref:BTB domain-containing protein n=1 Tax=Rhizoctonia solani TaxID=456999 RepID=A0A8H3BMJ9_9AGAM|nr:unnamed protein product [Rhizoctonia solani]
MSAEYTIAVADKTFKLSKSQIEYDSPNLFTSYFLDWSDRSTSRRLEISRDPYLFAIIMRYLNGYQVLPLHPTLVPPHCTLETALADLRVDADFYQLSGLSSLLSSPKILEEQPAVVYVRVTGQYNTEADKLEPTENIDKVADGFGLELSDEQKYKKASQSDSFYAVPSNTKGGNPSVFYSGLLNERIVRRVLQREGNAAIISNWELLGWTRDYPGERCRRTFIFVKLWTKSGLTTNGSNPDVLG